MLVPAVACGSQGSLPFPRKRDRNAVTVGDYARAAAVILGNLSSVCVIAKIFRFGLTTYSGLLC